MPKAAIHSQPDATTERVLFMALELSENAWKLGFTTGHGKSHVRERS